MPINLNKNVLKIKDSDTNEWTGLSNLVTQQIDSTLSETSTNPIQNATVTKKLNQLSQEKVDKSQISQMAGNSEEFVMSQKAVTDLVANAIGGGGGGSSEYETVDSVEEMTDTSKSYVLSSTGTIWAYTSKQVFVEHNAYDSTTAQFNKRLNSLGVEKDLGGALMLPLVEQTYDTSCIVTISGIDSLVRNYSSYFTVNFFNGATHLGMITDGNYSISAGTLPISFNLFKSSAVKDISGVENTTHVSIKLGIAADGTTISASDVEGLVVNFSTKNGYQEVAGWYDTEMTAEQATTNYVDLLVKINQNTSDISEMNVRMTALETDGDSLIVPSWWEDAVNVCIAKIKNLQVGKNCVTFPFFSDNHENTGYSGVLIAKVMKECGIPYCFYGGDTIGSSLIPDEATMVAQDKRFDEMMSYIPDGRFCRALGNHDGFWKVSSTEKHGYTRNQVYELFLRAESLAQNKHFGGDGTYYYVDDIVSKVRWIILDTNPEPVGSASEIIDSEQLTWLQNTALSLDGNDWAVVIISHCPISNHYHANVTNSAEVTAVVNSSGVDVVGWFSGHIHRDRIYTHHAVNSTDGVEGENGEPLGFTQVVITSDRTDVAYPIPDSPTYHPITNDDKSHAIDFVTINKNTRTVNITRLGIGEDRSYTY